MTSGKRDPLPPLTTIHPRHAAYVRGLVSKLGVTPSHEHADLVQEILFQAYRSRDSPLEPRALLYGITRHVVFRFMARREHQRNTADKWQELQEKIAPTVEQFVDAATARALVEEAIAGLDERLLYVLIRCDLEDATMPMVAAELGIPVNTGYTRLHLARERLPSLVARVLRRHKLTKDDV